MRGLTLKAGVIVMIAVPVLEACSECKGGGGRSHAGPSAPAVTPTSTAVVAAPPPAPPTPPAPPAPPAPSPAAVVAQGATVPPIVPNSATVVDTSDGGGLKHLVFQATNSMEAGRYLSEYVVIIHAKDKSCVSMKVRPTSGVSNNANETPMSSDGTACNADGTIAAAAAAGTGTGTGTGMGAAPAGTGTGTAHLTDDPQTYLTYMDDDTKKQRGFFATSASTALCAKRLFRMAANQSGNQGLGAVVSKTGVLMTIGAKVRIWVDDEFTDACSGGVPLDQRPPTLFGPLIQHGFLSVNQGDKLWSAQLQNLADEMDKITTEMTGTYGAVSDVDNSGYVEVFLSPEVNRYYLNKSIANDVDDFLASYIYRPQDLAFYNINTNPLSNEGEILYLWTPDPGGIYSSSNFPTSNSVTSNYAKGYLASQLMTLIVANQRLIVQHAPSIDDDWLLQSMAGLASAYYAGNDFTYYFLAQYLTSRPATISLTEKIDPAAFPDTYLGNANDEQFGMRTMFGWYLHSRLCGGDNVNPCAKLKDMITSTKTGTDAVIELTGDKDFNTAIENFGLSVAVSLIDKPDQARAVWSQNPQPAGLPMAPTKLPDLTKIADARVTSEESHDSTGQGSAILGTDPADPSWAGPFPAKSMMMFQPLVADSDLQFAVAKNALGIVLVTALIDQQTDVTSELGKNLNVTFVPSGELDTSLRRIHIEKVSENARTDVRPDNLVGVSKADTTYIYPPAYPSLDYSVTPSRQIWILGSIDNFPVSVEGSPTTLGGSGAYDLMIKPCDGVADQATCLAANHVVFIQAQIRDFEKQLEPMLIVTDTDRTTFRGHATAGRVKDLDASFTGDKNQDVYMLCEDGSASSANLATFQNITTVTADTTTGLTTIQNVQPSLATLAVNLPIINSVDLAVNSTVVSIGATSATLSLAATQTGGGVTLTQPGTVVTTASPHGLATGATVHFTVNGNMPKGIDFGNSQVPATVMPFKDYTVTVLSASTLTLTDPGTGKAVYFGSAGTADLHATSFSVCANGGMVGHNVYDHTLTQANPKLYLHDYDDFLQLGLLGFPFTTSNTITYENAPIHNGTFDFLKVEEERQYFNFAMSKALLPTHFHYYPGTTNFPDMTTKTILAASDVNLLASLKDAVDYCTTPDPQVQGFIDECDQVAGLTATQCSNVCFKNGYNNIQPTVLSYITINTVAVCASNDCTAFEKLTVPGPHTSAWLSSSNLYIYNQTGAGGTRDTYYVPNQPDGSQANAKYCFGDADPVNAAPSPSIVCQIRTDSISELADIRNQLNVVTSKLKDNEDINCAPDPTKPGHDVVGTDFQACIDPISVRMEYGESDASFNFSVTYGIPGERARSPYMPIATRAGEIIAKPERFQSVMLQVPGAGAPINVIIGGRKQSTGKYLLRARIVN